MTNSPEGKSYKDTVHLPKTAFPMKANLVQNEPASVKRWQQTGVYQAIRTARAGRPRWNFHDGPPYANGSMHMGHLMNKCLKDFVVRSRTMMNFDVPYIPGWDCHGLPIEHKVMTDLVESGKAEKLGTLDRWTRAAAVRRECQKHAEKYIKLQAGQLQRFLTLADYDHPYLTMSREYEAATLDVLAGLMDRGLVFRALKPVHWSVANETALAEAELEYQDREDRSIYVDFEAADAEAVYNAFGLPPAGDEEEDASPPKGEETSRAPKPGRRPAQRPCFMIWTTTPWTLPANLAIAVNPRFEYALAWIDGNVTVLAAEAVSRVTKAAKAEEAVVLASTTGEKLLGLRYRHPFLGGAEAQAAHVTKLRTATSMTGPDAAFSLVPAEYVTLEDGTGLVHTAPGHGSEDFQTGQRVGLPTYCPVRGNGTYDDTVPEWLRGVDIWKANDSVVNHLRDSGHLFFDHVFTHSYPHDWRSKTPVIFRATEQWFVGVDRTFEVEGDSPRSLRDRALGATEGGGVAFVPEWGRNRMRGMLESRPDWCISRQRAWGLPIPAFVMKTGGDETTFMTAAMVRAVIAVVREKGSDAWFTLPPSALLAGYSPEQDTDPAARDARFLAAFKGGTVDQVLTKGGDILDVWFESGSSWNAVLRTRNLGYPAELYLEGSDQHRGWFQASLLPALGVTGRAPYRTLLTHGFMVDRDGKKLSKSRPDAHRYEVESLCTEFGIDVMRWWVSSLAYENDVKVDVELFALAGESYRKIRNTLRYMLSTAGSAATPAAPATAAPAAEPTSIDAWALGEFDRLVHQVSGAFERYEFHAAHKALFDFCNDTMSATYLAAVKDRLYCDAATSPRRMRTQATIRFMADGLCRLLAPLLPHTADEAWRTLHGVPPADPASVHTQLFPTPSGASPDTRWQLALQEIEKARTALEKAKSSLGVENPLDAGVVLGDSGGSFAAFDRVDLADLLGVSEVTLEAGATAVRVIDLRERPRCERSWRRDGTVKKRSDGGMLSDRDAAALGLS